MPQTLAQLVRAKHPGAYDDLSDQRLESSIKAKHPGVYDDLPTSSLPTRPVSAEDFIKPEPSKGWPAKIGDAFLGAGKSLLGGAEALSDLQRAAVMGDTDAAQRTATRARGLFDAQGAEVQKAVDAAQSGDKLQAAAHGLTAAIPLVGPAMAQAGEKIGRGDWEGVGEGALLALAPVAGDVAPLAGKAAGAAGRAGAAAGRGVGTVASAALQAAPEMALDAVVSHSLGHVAPVATVAKIARSVAEGVRASKAAKAAESDASAVNAGGRLVKDKAPTAEQAVSDVLANLDTSDAPRGVELPPPAQLPAGYAPRTSAPAPKGTVRVNGKLMPEAAAKAFEARRVAAEAKRAETGPRNYFLKKPEPAADVPDVDVPPDALPAAWRGYTEQPLIPPQGRAGQQFAADVAQALKETGVSVDEAVAEITRRKDLTPMQRLQIRRALQGAR